MLQQMRQHEARRQDCVSEHYHFPAQTHIEITVTYRAGNHVLSQYAGWRSLHLPSRLLHEGRLFFLTNQAKMGIGYSINN